MTTKQKQHLLAFMGYYTGVVDGIWGQQSQDATTRFQKDFGLTADGDFGEETDARIRKAVGNYDDLILEVPGTEPVADNNVGDKITPTGDFWDEIEFFTREEFRCQCGGKYCNGFPVEPEEKMVRTIDEIRRRLGVPITIVESGGSGIRCERHNASIENAAPNSEHLYGRAADLHSSASPERMRQIAESVLAGTGGLGVYSWGIHVDTGKYSRWNG